VTKVPDQSPALRRARAGKTSQDFVGRPRAGRERCSVERELTENKSERELEESVQEQERCQAGRERCSAARELHEYESGSCRERGLDVGESERGLNENEGHSGLGCAGLGRLNENEGERKAAERE